jgi:hypothetical protein
MYPATKTSDARWFLRVTRAWGELREQADERLRRQRFGPSRASACHAEVGASMALLLLPHFPINIFRPESSVFAVHLCRQIGNAQMASHAIAFFAGVGTTFAILTAGFSGGLVFTKAAVDDRRVLTGQTPDQRHA